MVNFGKRLKKLRLQHELSQEQLAKRLGMTKSVVSAYENGIRMPSYEALITIARIFKVSTDYLLGMESNKYLDLSGLSSAEISALKKLVKTMQGG